MRNETGPGIEYADLREACNAASSLDTSSPLSREVAELTRKRSRTDSEHERLRELECQRSLWLSDDGRPMIPRAALRACIEAAARRSKEGPSVRSGLVVDDRAIVKSGVRRVGHATALLSSVTSMPSWNFTPSITLPS